MKQFLLNITTLVTFRTGCLPPGQCIEIIFVPFCVWSNYVSYLANKSTDERGFPHTHETLVISLTFVPCIPNVVGYFLKFVLHRNLIKQMPIFLGHILMVDWLHDVTCFFIMYIYTVYIYIYYLYILILYIIL